MKVINTNNSIHTALTVEQVRHIAKEIHGGSESVLLDDDCIGEFSFKIAKEHIMSMEITYVRAKVVDDTVKFWPIQPVKETVLPEKCKHYLEKFKTFPLSNILDKRFTDAT